MRIIFAFIAAIMFLSSSLIPPAAYADDQAEKLKVAQEYLETSIADMDMTAVIDTIWPPLIANAESGGTKVDDAQKSEVRKIFQDALNEPMKQTLLSQAATIADVFTLDELTALRDFYLTDVGRSAMKKFPKLMEVQQPVMMEFVNRTMVDIMPKVLKVLKLEQ